MEIIAKGKICGNTVKISYKDGVIKSAGLDDLINFALEQVEPIGGTYYPEKDSPLNVYFAFKECIFDEEPQMEVIGELPAIPYEEGVIY